jgi:hypothetical protein
VQSRRWLSACHVASRLSRGNSRVAIPDCVECGRGLVQNEKLDCFLNRFQDAEFVLESTGIWEFIYEGVEKRGFEVVLTHPLKVRAISEASVKTD